MSERCAISRRRFSSSSLFPEDSGPGARSFWRLQFCSLRAQVALAAKPEISTHQHQGQQDESGIAQLLLLLLFAFHQPELFGVFFGGEALIDLLEFAGVVALVEAVLQVLGEFGVAQGIAVIATYFLVVGEIFVEFDVLENGDIPLDAQFFFNIGRALE